MAAIAVTLAAFACVSPTDPTDTAVLESAAAEAEQARSALRPRGGLAWQNYFPNVELITHNGERVRFYDDLLKGKIVVINFMYASCTDS